MIIATGAIYFMSNSQMANIFLLFLLPALISSSKTSFGIFQEANIEMTNAPSGNNTFDTKKSDRSKKVLPKIVKSLNRPYDKADGIPKMKMRIPMIHVIFLRLV